MNVRRFRLYSKGGSRNILLYSPIFHVTDSIPASMSLRCLRPSLNGRNYVGNILAPAKSLAKTDAIRVISGVCYHLRTPPLFKEGVYIFLLFIIMLFLIGSPTAFKPIGVFVRIGSSLPIHAKPCRVSSQGQNGYLSPTSGLSFPLLQDTLQS